MLSEDTLKDLTALSLVRETFAAYETYRSNTYDHRFRAADELYFGILPQRTWEGTKIPRSSLSTQLVFDQVETAAPAIHQALFGADSEWFQVVAEPGTMPQEARAIRDKLLYDFDRSRFQREAKLALKDVLLYGYGGVKLYWDEETRGARAEWVDVRDFYFDPNASTPDLGASRSVICRRLMTVDELDKYRDMDGMNVPEKAVLVHLSENRHYTIGDTVKTTAAAMQGLNHQAGSDYIANPAQKFIEVLMYYDQDRIVWTLNREVVAYNARNPYGFIPFFFAPCYIFPGQPHGVSFAVALEKLQKYSDAIYNAHVDDLALALNPPRVQSPGANDGPEAVRWRPGATFQQSDPRAFQTLAPNGVTTNVFQDLDVLERRAEKRTGINSIGQGSPRPSNVNRTAAGMQTALQGSSARLQELAENIEDYMLVPMLEGALRMIQYHLDPGETVTYLGPNQQYMQVGEETFRAPVRFKMVAASKMATRDKLSQQFQFITQYLLNGQVIGELKNLGMVVDFTEWVQLLKDATGTERTYALIRPMNEQEQQQAQQPSPEQIAAQEQAQQDAQVRVQMGQLSAQKTIQTAQIKAETDLQRTQLMEDQETARAIMLQLMKDESEKQKLRNDARKADMQIERERQKVQTEAQAAAQRLQFGAQEGQQKLQLKALEMQAKQAEIAQQLQASRAQGEQDLGLKRLEGVTRLQQLAAESRARYNRPRGERS